LLMAPAAAIGSKLVLATARILEIAAKPEL
jgi:hypothetical protein